MFNSLFNLAVDIHIVQIASSRLSNSHSSSNKYQFNVLVRLHHQTTTVNMSWRSLSCVVYYHQRKLLGSLNSLWKHTSDNIERHMHTVLRLTAKVSMVSRQNRSSTSAQIVPWQCVQHARTIPSHQDQSCEEAKQQVPSQQQPPQFVLRFRCPEPPTLARKLPWSATTWGVLLHHCHNGPVSSNGDGNDNDGISAITARIGRL